MLMWSDDWPCLLAYLRNGHWSLTISGSLSLALPCAQADSQVGRKLVVHSSSRMSHLHSQVPKALSRKWYFLL